MGVSSLVEAAQAIGKYSLIEKIGEGSLGTVYRGFDQDLGRPVVVRILSDGIRWDARLQEVFDNECRALAGLKHLNIAAVFESGREGHCRYVAMESLGSGTLQNLIAQNSAVPVETKLSIMIQLAEGLGYAHKKGILHRNLGPRKIHLTTDGNAKIRDFGLASLLTKHLPHPAVRWGVPIYLSPEQIQQKNYDARSEIFSLGTIFYELITHFHPFHDPDSNKALDNVLSEAQIPTFERFPDAPPGIWTILRTCLAKNPEERYRSMDELSAACRELLKSLAEDTQLILSELYASLSPLRKAAAQTNASASTLHLLNEIEDLLRGTKEAGYAHLDQLMTELMEQYPEIQAAASAPPALGPICPQLPPEGPGTPALMQSGSLPPETESKPAPPTESEARRASDAVLLPEEQPAEIEAIPESAVEGPDQSADASIDAMATQGMPEEMIQLRPEPAHESAPGNTEQPALLPERGHAQPPPVALALEHSGVQEESVPVDRRESASFYDVIQRHSYGIAAASLALLVVALAGYLVLATYPAEAVRKAWAKYTPSTKSLFQGLIPRRTGEAEKSSGTGTGDARQTTQDAASQVPAKEGPGPAAENSETNKTDRSLEQSISQISALLNSGKLQAAKTELDRMQLAYPDAPGITGLRKRWQALTSKQLQEKDLKVDDQQKAISKKEDEWNRQLGEFMARGKYNESAEALTLWLSENPGSFRAQDLNSKVQEIQRHLKAYGTAMAESRYADALNSLSSAEKLNPADTGFAELRRQAEAKKAAARAILTVHRLGAAKAVLLLDGRPIGKNGEIQNESIPIGSHTITIEYGGGLVASRIQESAEGQRIVLVYDLVKQTLRPMTEADRDSLAMRRAMEEAERFQLEHDHGVFRGSCRGVLSLDSLDVAYIPSSGTHGFRIPFKLLNMKLDGKSVSLYYNSDNSRFQAFKFQDDQEAERFRQKWDELKAILRGAL